MSPVRGGPADPWDDHTDEDRDLFPDYPDLPLLSWRERLGWTLFLVLLLALWVAMFVGIGMLLGWLLL